MSNLYIFDSINFDCGGKISNFTRQKYVYMNKGNIIRFGFIVVLWITLCYLLITRSPKIDFMMVFSIIASGIIVFVPLYKKYLKK